MAIYHLHAQTIGRGSGKSAVAAAAYRSTSKLTDNETGIICDYTKKEKALFEKILTPPDAPEWVNDREKLWNEVQKKENRKNSHFAWEYDIALPYEVRSSKMIDRFCQENFVSKGLICDYAIHKPDKHGDQRNYHVHIMITTRKMTAEGWGEKHRCGENKMSDRIEWLKEVRKSWEKICNKELELRGSNERIDCRTLEAQGIDRVPQRHHGSVAKVKYIKNLKQELKPDSLAYRMVFNEEGNTRYTYSEKLRYEQEKQDREQNEFEKEKVEKEFKWEKENELKLIQEKIRLANLSDSEFKAEEKNIVQGQLKAQALATRELLPEIEKANDQEKKQLQEKSDAHYFNKPQEIYPKPNVVKNFFMMWRSEDGKEHKTWEGYATQQQKIINEWGKKLEPFEEQKKALNTESEKINQIKKDGVDIQLDPLNRLLDLSREQEKKRPTIFEKIKTKAQDIFYKAAEFAGYREFKNSYDEVREAREETKRQRAREIERQRAVEQQRERTQDKDRGGWSR